MRKTLTLAWLVFAAACGGGAAGEDVLGPRASGPELLDAGADAGAPSVFFDADWSYGAVGPLVPGTPEALHYDLARLSQCTKPSDAGQDWTLTAYVSGDGATPIPVAANSWDLAAGATSVDLPFEVPFAGTVSVWFAVTSNFGCQAWDSNFGQNFDLPVAPAAPPLIHFKSDFTEEVEGTLSADQPFTVAYDLARLPGCRGTYGAGPAWSVQMYYAFDGAAPSEVEMETSFLGQLIGVPRVVTPPAGARSVAFWFENVDVDGCNAWDSSYGQNFSFGL